MADQIEAINSGVTLIKQIDDVLDIFRPFKPEVKRFRINYLDRSSEIKYLLKVPNGIKRNAKRIVELPITAGFLIDEVFDLDSLSMVNVEFDVKEGKYVVNANELPSNENYLVTLKGRVSKAFLDELVMVNCAVNPTKMEESDCYWIHSALKDVSILENVWDELNIDRINTDVHIGVQRLFSSTIPQDVRERLKVQQKLLSAIAGRERNRSILELDYRRSLLKSSISPQELYNLLVDLASGDFFSNYLKVDQPFKMGLIEPSMMAYSLIPSSIRVGVSTDLNFRVPATEGNLTFERIKYETSIVDELKKLEDKSA